MPPNIDSKRGLVGMLLAESVFRPEASGTYEASGEADRSPRLFTAARVLGDAPLGQGRLEAALHVLGLTVGDLPKLCDDLSAAYRAAVTAKAADRIAVLRPALMRIGRHYAACLGPRAARLPLN